MNSITIVGRIKEQPVITTTAKGNPISWLLIEADRNFHNDDGSVSQDIFNVMLWKGIAEEVSAACKPGNLVAVRGRLSGDAVERNEKTFYNLSIIAEKVEILTRAKH
ncbi:single-stranded DNA-binding protein [Stecheria intestinalis]|uniref:single-stranded DNA-binding protein n=1 Tax=Stecheria intestinalis TaxID=2606630 RepID=UPI0023F3D5BE|nr:single-stranded DNA-binding protein [Stecheria intestinalis]MCI6746706.1 single-stranded DNA-binding protein [Anaerolactibacter massiliensis]MDD5882268.1 single-stranded DNA-binding protein [Stecheria intestinalis]